MNKSYKGKERRKFVRLDYVSPLAFKICKRKTISSLLKGYTSNVSESGLLCTINNRVKINDILWLSFDRTTLSICEDLERRVFLYQNGILGRVVRVKPRPKGRYQLGLQFITREEKNLTNIFPKAYFIVKKKGKDAPILAPYAETLRPQAGDEYMQGNVSDAGRGVSASSCLRKAVPKGLHFNEEV